MTTRSTLSATAALTFFMVGTPVMIVSRLLSGLLPMQDLDLVLVILAVGWVFIFNALIQRDEPLESLTQQRFSLKWQADNLVAQSLLGAGLVAHTTADEVGLVCVGTPQESVEGLMPPPAVEPERAKRLQEGAETPVRVIPNLGREPAADGPEILATEEYVVARGDTFWSISEYAFGDGRHWKSVQELNLGREVAPGVVLNESHEPRIGWSIVIPLVESSDEDDDQNS